MAQHSVGKEIRKSRRAERHSRREILCRRERLIRKGNFILHVGLIDFLYCLVFSARVVPFPLQDDCEWARPFCFSDENEAVPSLRGDTNPDPGVDSDIYSILGALFWEWLYERLQIE
jgi:hypothetical protein